MFVPRQYLECLDSNAHMADVLLDTEDMQGALRAGGDVWELCSVDEWVRMTVSDTRMYTTFFFVERCLVPTL